jgi:hypothetical protein
VVVAEAEDKGEDQCGRPEAKGMAMAGIESQAIDGGEAASESVLNVAAKEVLFQQSDDEKAGQPDDSVAKNIAAEEEALVDHEEAGFGKDEDEQREEGDSPAETCEETGSLAVATETIDAHGTGLDLRHDPGNDDGPRKLSALHREQESRVLGFVAVVLQMEEMKDGEEGDSKEQEEEEQPPASAQALVSDEDAVECRRRGRRRGAGKWGLDEVVQRAVAPIVESVIRRGRRNCSRRAAVDGDVAEDADILGDIQRRLWAFCSFEERRSAG